MSKINRLPSDELDDIWENLKGFIPIFILLLAGLGPFIARKATVSHELKWIVLTTGIIIFIYTFYCKLTERNTKFIHTDLSKEQNENLIQTIEKKENWSAMNRKEYFHYFHFPFVKFHFGFKLTLIPTENGIYINFRNRGSIQGRTPYLFGVETYKERKIRRIIKNYAQHYVALMAGNARS